MHCYFVLLNSKLFVKENMSEKYKLTRNESNYFANGILSISSFSDVILVSEDMKEFSAHKLILSATSNFLKLCLNKGILVSLLFALIKSVVLN